MVFCFFPGPGISRLVQYLIWWWWGSLYLPQTGHWFWDWGYADIDWLIKIKDSTYSRWFITSLCTVLHVYVVIKWCISENVQDFLRNSPSLELYCVHTIRDSLKRIAFLKISEKILSGNIYFNTRKCFWKNGPTPLPLAWNLYWSFCSKFFVPKYMVNSVCPCLFIIHKWPNI